MKHTDVVYQVSWPISGPQHSASVHHVADPANGQRTLCGRRNRYRHSEGPLDRYGWRFKVTVARILKAAEHPDYTGTCKLCAKKLAQSVEG